MDLKDLDKAQKIEQQVERWDLFAKLAPTFFLIICFIFLALGVGFDTLFTIGMIGFAMTAVTWWFWTLFTIRFLVRIFHRATLNLIETGSELKAVKQEYQELRNEENNRS